MTQHNSTTASEHGDAPRSDDAGLTDPAALSPRQLLERLEALTPDAPELGAVDVDAVARAVDPTSLSRTELSRFLLALDRLSDAVDFRTIQPGTFARLIGRASKAQLNDVLGHPRLRTLVLEEIFRRMSEHLRRDRTESMRAVVHWRFTGGSGSGGYDRYETVIDHGTCSASTLTEQSQHSPRATITLAPTDFLHLIIGQASAPLLFMTGKLKVKGDLAFAAGLTSLFDLPSPD